MPSSRLGSENNKISEWFDWTGIQTSDHGKAALSRLGHRIRYDDDDDNNNYYYYTKGDGRMSRAPICRFGSLMQPKRYCFEP